LFQRTREYSWFVQKLGVGLAMAAVFALSSPRPCLSQPEANNPSGKAGSNGHKMDAQTKANAFHQVLKIMAAGERPDPQLWSEFVAAQNDDGQTGPKIGEKVPDFTLPDQRGKQRSLKELMGPSGLLLAFTRSADW
jgi:hypothetical protein